MPTHLFLITITLTLSDVNIWGSYMVQTAGNDVVNKFKAFVA